MQKANYDHCDQLTDQIISFEKLFMTFRIFSAKRKLILNKKNKAVVIAMQQMLSHASSFQSFCNYNEVFDMNKKALITKRNNLFQLYAHGIGIDSPHLIINKN